MLATARGHAIRFPESDLRELGRATRGVRGITLRGKDRVVMMETLAPAGGPVLTVTARGYGKRTPVEEYRQQSRGGMGTINVKINDKSGEVVAVRQVDEGDGLVLISQDGMILRTQVAGVRVVGRGGVVGPGAAGAGWASLALAQPGRAATRVPRVLHFVAILRMPPAR